MTPDPITQAIEILEYAFDIYGDEDGPWPHIENALTALRQHREWRPIETLTDAEGDVILLNSSRNLVLSMDAKRWRTTIGYPDHLHFHADYWKPINPPKESDDERA